MRKFVLKIIYFFRFKQILPFLLLGFFTLMLSCLFLQGEDYGIIWGRVVNQSHQPLPRVKILIFPPNSSSQNEIYTNQSGYFCITGLCSGAYLIQTETSGYHNLKKNKIFLEPSRELRLRITLNSKKRKEGSFMEIFYLDYSNCLYQTVLNSSQLRDYPTAHNVWNLVENQDLSATTNRIDVGGLWGTIPALFSSRGSCSWTQNVYLLNGLNVTDPYWGGKPLFYPDFYTLRSTQLINAGLPPQTLYPGAYFNLNTKQETKLWHGGVSTFYIHKVLQSSNISSSLRKEGINQSHRFNHFIDGNFHLSGPLITDRLSLFVSASGFHLSRDIAEFKRENKSSVISGLLSLKYGSQNNHLRFVWSEQRVSHPSFGADRNVPFYSTFNRKNTYNLFQIIWNTKPKANHFFKLGLCLAQGNVNSEFQKSNSEPYSENKFNGIRSGSAPYSGVDKRQSLTFLLQGNSIFSAFLKAKHNLHYGFQAQHCFSSSQRNINDNIHLRFFNGEPLEVVKYNTPLLHREAAFHLNFFAEDSLTFPNFFSFYLGFNLAVSRGWVPQDEKFALLGKKSKISWVNLSPRLGFIIPLTPSKMSVLKLSFARYYFTLPLHYLTHGNPNSMGSNVFSWEDKNGDSRFQHGEEGVLLRREGPYFPNNRIRKNRIKYE